MIRKRLLCACLAIALCLGLLPVTALAAGEHDSHSNNWTEFTAEDMEIERKFLIDKENLPENLEQFPCRQIEQGYLCTAPVVRIRRQDEEYYLTYKSAGLMAREEYNLPLDREAYLHLKPKADGLVIAKTRYLMPEKDGLTIELDVFHEEYEGLLLAEVEFPSEEAANAYIPPAWFGEDVTYSSRYHNSTLSRGTGISR